MKQLGDFKFRLPEPPATLVECKTDLESTAWALQKLLECNDDNTHQLLEKHSDIQRLFRPKVWRANGAPYITEMFFNRMETCYSVALYLFLEDDKLFSDGEQNCCKQCQNLNSKGPFDKCISGGEDVAKGACLNCFYSSSGTNCSLRKDLKRKAEEEARSPPRFPTESQRRNATPAEMELWIQQLEDELRRRNEALVMDRLNENTGQTQ